MVDSRLSSRFVFILHADVVDSTSLVQADEKLAHERIRSAFEALSREVADHGGAAVEVRGDAVVAEFEKASDAVSAALSFQAGHAPHAGAPGDDGHPLLRIGISMGEVIVADETVTGAGVALAQRLEQLAGPGEVVIQGAVREAIPVRMPFRFTDLGDREMKGFDMPIKACGVHLAPGGSVPEPERGRRARRGRRGAAWLASAVLAALAVAGVSLWLGAWRTADAPPAGPVTGSGADRPTIAVMPFANLSDDPGQSYFSDGISEDIITDLSRISSLGVIARNSSFAYRASAAGARQIATELGVGYVLEGSVRKAGERVRITAQLIDAASGESIWGNRYDRLLVDIFDLQDEIRNKIVSALSIQLMGDEAENLARRATESFKAYDLFLQGRRLYNEYTLASLERAESLYRDAIALDPEFARAHGALGIAISRKLTIDSTETDRQARLDEALQAVVTAASIEPTSPQVQWALGFVHMHRGEHLEAARAVEESVSLSPNFADGWGLLALLNNQLGRGDQALRFIRKGMSLNPAYSWDYPYNEGRALYNLAQYEDAVEPLLRALERNPNAWNPRLYLAASYVRLGRLADAEWEIVELQTNNPVLTLSHLSSFLPIAEGDHRRRFLEDLKAAGLPE